MTWRPWVVTSAMFAAFVLNVTMFASEDLLPPSKEDDPRVIPTDRIQSDLVWVAENRRRNFELMGLPPDMADEAVGYVKREYKERREALAAALKAQEDLTSRIFCKSADPPTRYAAMSVLVVPADGEGMQVRVAAEIADFEGQDWYAQAPIRAVYTHLELADEGDYHPDATLMGVAALMLGEGDKVVNMEYPWGTGTLTNAWSYSALQADYQKKKIRDKLVRYFSVMALLAEISNADNGICR